MPFYTYRSKDHNAGCGLCSESYEVLQKISEPPLANCPECKATLVRLMHPTATIKDNSTKKTLSDDNLRKHGFKKLVNAGGGKFDEVV